MSQTAHRPVEGAISSDKQSQVVRDGRIRKKDVLQMGGLFGHDEAHSKFSVADLDA